MVENGDGKTPVVVRRMRRTGFIEQDSVSTKQSKRPNVVIKSSAVVNLDVAPQNCSDSLMSSMRSLRSSRHESGKTHVTQQKRRLKKAMTIDLDMVPQLDKPKRPPPPSATPSMSAMKPSRSVSDPTSAPKVRFLGHTMGYRPDCAEYKTDQASLKSLDKEFESKTKNELKEGSFFGQMMAYRNEVAIEFFHTNGLQTSLRFLQKTVPSSDTRLQVTQIRDAMALGIPVIGFEKSRHASLGIMCEDGRHLLSWCEYTAMVVWNEMFDSYCAHADLGKSLSPKNWSWIVLKKLELKYKTDLRACLHLVASSEYLKWAADKRAIMIANRSKKIYKLKAALDTSSAMNAIIPTKLASRNSKAYLTSAVVTDVPPCWGPNGEVQVEVKTLSWQQSMKINMNRLAETNKAAMKYERLIIERHEAEMKRLAGNLDETNQVVGEQIGEVGKVQVQVKKLSWNQGMEMSVNRLKDTNMAAMKYDCLITERNKAEINKRLAQKLNETNQVVEEHNGEDIAVLKRQQAWLVDELAELKQQMNKLMKRKRRFGPK
ncbi:hypothetical protein MPSEU_000349100 [Mayamaea pseudoterrestris]|nr:hypothetical protein MPSEU_000349100 [Mayamaea pseudoterrestris]